MLLFLAAMTAAVTEPQVAVDDESAIVIIAQRTGVPVWRVRSGATTVVLVGTIPDIPDGTRWNAEALETAVSQSSRVLFPQTVGLSAVKDDFDAWMKKWTKQAFLPAGQSLSSMLSPVDRERLARLVERRIAPKDWDKVHPLHLALKMQSSLRDRTLMGPSADDTVTSAIKKYKVYRIPVARTEAEPVMRGLFASKPQDHLPCLEATLAVVEAGSDELRRRSKAWADRDVPAAIASPVQAIETSCWPAKAGKAVDPDLLAATTKALKRKGTTLAVINLDTLARRGGLLDRLEAAGMTIAGPNWR